jgi:hypothetical protein
MCNLLDTESEENATEREKLQRAILRAENADKRLCDDSRTIIEAARRHLATLPKTKKMWRVSHSECGETKTWNVWAAKADALWSAQDALKCGKSCVSINSYDAPA